MNLPLEKQVCSLDLARRLKELGVKQRGVLFGHILNAGRPTGGIVDATMYDDLDDDYWSAKLVSAFTVAELGAMLLNRDNLRFFYANAAAGMEWCAMGDTNREYADTEADARAKCLVYLIENKLITAP